MHRATLWGQLLQEVEVMSKHLCSRNILSSSRITRTAVLLLVSLRWNSSSTVHRISTTSRCAKDLTRHCDSAASATVSVYSIYSCTFKTIAAMGNIVLMCHYCNCWTHSCRRRGRGVRGQKKFIREKYFSGNYYVKCGNLGGKYNKNLGILIIFPARIM